MAGFYADVPGPRLPYDRDGSIAYGWNLTNGTFNMFSTETLREINDEDSVDVGSLVGFTGNTDIRYVIFMFPELKNIVGWYLNINSTSSWTQQNIETSVDTTNGIDGTWVVRQANWAGLSSGGSVVPTYRTAINAVTWSGIKGVRFGFTSFAGGVDGPRFNAIHFYGSPAASAPRLALWHPTLDQEVTGAYFDWGDVPTSTAATRNFRVKNLSSTQTAQSVGLTMEALFDTSPTVVGQHTFSPDGTTFTSTLNIGSLAPSTISSVLTLKRTTPSNASLSLWAARIITLPGAWV